MDRPVIVIRDIHHYGDDRAVPEATARLCAGGPAAVTRPPVPELQGGDRVALEHTDDPHTRLRPGDEGTVTRYDPKLGRLDVNWDGGSTLAMLLDDGDRVRLVTPAPREPGKEAGR